MLADMGHPFAPGRGGLRRHLRERAGGPAHRLPVPPRQPGGRAGDRHRRPLGAGARLVHLRRRRPDEPLRGQRRRAQDPDPAPDPLGDRQRRGRSPDGEPHPPGDPRHRDLPRAGAGGRRTTARRAPRPRSAPTRCRTSTCSTRCATASGRRRSPSWRCTPGATRRAAHWPPDFPETKRVAYDLPEIRRWLGVFLKRFFGFSQFKRSALPNGPKVSAGGSLSPRGDWRAPSDGSARIWIAELERNVPET